MSLNKTIVALDQMTLDEIDSFLLQKENILPVVKIGLEMFLKHGPDLVEKIHNKYNKKIFLDLKLHDIPITVERAINSLQHLPIEFLTIHLSGGEEMINAALKEARRVLPGCKILGVSFLTSLETNDLAELFGISNSEEAFLRLFGIANKTKIDGVICSPHEITLLKKNFPSLLAITPGIRFSDEIQNQATQDQKRVSTPSEAFKHGADFIVIGRSLTKSKNLSTRINELTSIKH
jgi:orotidine-5'-phosphate decarboxylase